MTEKLEMTDKQEMTDKADDACRALLTELNQVLTDRTHAATATRVSLRDAVCAYVEVETAMGSSLRTITGTVKEILQKAEAAAATDTTASRKRDNSLAKQLVDWCTEFHRSARARIA